MTKIQIGLLSLVGVMGLMVSPLAFATDFSSTHFTVKDPVIVPGAGFATTTDFQLITSISQGVIGESTSNSFRLKQGFLYFPAPSVAGGGGGTPPPPIIVPGLGGGFGPHATSTTTTIPRIPRLPNGKSPDFNHNGRVDISDFSVLLFFYGTTVTPATDRYDLNSDGVIDFYDLSILFYYWI